MRIRQQLIRSLLMRSLQFIRSLQLVNRLHLAPRALPRQKALEVKNSLVSSELTATYGVRPLAV